MTRATKLLEQMTDEEVDNDQRLQISVTLDRLQGYLSAPYEGRERMGDETALQALTDSRLIRQWIESAETELVAEARGAGDSWQSIGNALGISRQAAWERFDRKGYEKALIDKASGK